jgi:hypothetical protein
MTASKKPRFIAVKDRRTGKMRPVPIHDPSRRRGLVVTRMWGSEYTPGELSEMDQVNTTIQAIVSSTAYENEVVIKNWDASAGFAHAHPQNGVPYHQILLPSYPEWKVLDGLDKYRVYTAASWHEALHARVTAEESSLDQWRDAYNPDLYRNLWNIVEDERIENYGVEIDPGMISRRELLRSYLLSHQPKVEEILDPGGQIGQAFLQRFRCGRVVGVMRDPQRRRMVEDANDYAHKKLDEIAKLDPMDPKDRHTVAREMKALTHEIARMLRLDNGRLQPPSGASQSSWDAQSDPDDDPKGDPAQPRVNQQEQKRSQRAQEAQAKQEEAEREERDAQDPSKVLQKKYDEDRDFKKKLDEWNEAKGQGDSEKAGDLEKELTKELDKEMERKAQQSKDKADEARDEAEKQEADAEKRDAENKKKAKELGEEEGDWTEPQDWDEGNNQTLDPDDAYRDRGDNNPKKTKQIMDKDLKEKEEDAEADEGNNPSHGKGHGNGEDRTGRQVSAQDYREAREGDLNEKEEYKAVRDAPTRQDLHPDLSVFAPIPSQGYTGDLEDPAFQRKMKDKMRDWIRGKKTMHPDEGMRFDPTLHARTAGEKNFTEVLKKNVKGQKYMFVLDFSGSMSPREKEYKKVLANTFQVIDSIGGKLAIFGFGGIEVKKDEHTEGYFKVKTFEEQRWQRQHMKRLASVYAEYGSTPLDVCYSRAEKYMTRQKPDMVITITDGAPDNSRVVSQQLRDYKRRLRGTRFVGFGIGDEYMAQRLKDLGYDKSLSTEDLSKLPEKIVNLIAPPEFSAPDKK